MPSSRRELLLAMAGISGTVVMVAFDATIVSTTMPKVAQVLNGMELYASVGAAYFLAIAASILVFGRLGDIYGRKRLMLFAVSIEALGSIACGLSCSMVQLIFFRAFEGIGGGMMIATAFAAPADLFPNAQRRVRWMSLMSVAFALASITGTVIGGTVIQVFSWRAAFFVSPIAAAVTLILLSKYFPQLPPPEKKDYRIDWAGAIFVIIATTAPLTALELAFVIGDPTNGRLACSLAVFGMLAIFLLFRHESTVSAPIFPLRILANRESRLLTLTAVFIGAVMFNLILYSPLLLQHELGYTPSQSGLLLTPLVAGIPIGSIINGQLFPRRKAPKYLMTIGGLFLAIGCAMELKIHNNNTSPIWIIPIFFTNGLGLGFLLPNISILMQVLSNRQDIGVASALIQAMRAIGGAVGSTLVGIFINYSSILQGIRASLVLNTILALASVLIVRWVKVKNFRTSYS